MVMSVTEILQLFDRDVELFHIAKPAGTSATTAFVAKQRTFITLNTRAPSTG